jgi:hypothetical protein
MKESSKSKDDGSLILLYYFDAEKERDRKGQHADEEGSDRQESFKESLLFFRGFRCDY